MTKNLHFESGRSIVEMLGTLAIIGVLSIGGITGYSYGMDKYRANRTMYDVNVRAVDVLAQFDATGDASLDGWKNEKTIYPITLEDETIGIQVSGVPTRVCELMVEGMENSAKAVKINAEYVGENAGDCGDENTLVFYFDEDEESGGRVEKCGDIVCEQCQTCDTSTNTCVAVPDGTLPSDMPTCVNNGYKSYCVMGTCLPDGSKECGGDPECSFYMEGECLTLDSGYLLEAGIEGYRCTKNGQDGFCMAGICEAFNSVDCPGDKGCVVKINGECLNIISTCTKDNKNGVCSTDGICMPDKCFSERQCKSKEYCASPNTSDNMKYPDGYGTCKPIVEYFDIIFNGKTYYISKEPISGWDLENNGCSTINKEGISVSEAIVNYNDLPAANEVIFTDLGQKILEYVDTMGFKNGTFYEPDPTLHIGGATLNDWPRTKVHIVCE